MTTLMVWMILAFPGLWHTPGLSQVGLPSWQPHYSVYAAYSTSFGSLLGTHVSWTNTQKGLNLGLTLLRTDQATYGGFDLLLQRAFLGGTWSLEVHYLRSLEGLSTGPPAFRWRP